MVATTSYDTPRDPLMSGNHLTAVRWVLAGLVALGHIFLLTTAYEPIRIHQWTGGYMAVNGFFVLSGLLIAKSLDLRRDLKLYAVSRALRIYPALIVLMLAFIFVFATIFSKPGGAAAIGSTENWLYVLRVLALGDPQNAPGGIFSGNIEEDFNGPLWTIRFEIVAYILAAIGFAVGLLKSRVLTLVTFLGVQSAYLGLPLFIDFSTLPTGLLPLLRLSSAFLMGMCLWQFPEARRPHWILVAIAVAAFLLFGRGFGGELLGNLALTGLILRLGLTDKTFAPLRKLPDYSYGIYIWHYPVMQAVLFFNPQVGPAKLALYSIPVFLLLSAISWHLIEKPALKLKSKKRQQFVPENTMEGT
ncbi:acyltransferase family protein [Robiginitomaculum antarcticum]|uniref:acyltransferase family protein n=1 Tax=Robiginitomaculum antarcticum TaxID=437507 RepID=UPI000364A968|nr:acyltransferase [Robiginitomaculum antarcticum]